MEKLTLIRVRLSRYGYEIGSGQYWGIGGPLYRIDHSSFLQPRYVRANNRDHAKAAFRAQWPEADAIPFYR